MLSIGDGRTWMSVNRDDDGYVVMFMMGNDVLSQHYDSDGEPSINGNVSIDTVPIGDVSPDVKRLLGDAYAKAMNNDDVPLSRVSADGHDMDTLMERAAGHLVSIADKLVNHAFSEDNLSPAGVLSTMFSAVRVFGPSIMTAYEYGVSIGTIGSMLGIASETNHYVKNRFSWLHQMLDMQHEYSCNHESVTDIPCFSGETLNYLADSHEKVMLSQRIVRGTHANRMGLTDDSIRILSAFDDDMLQEIHDFHEVIKYSLREKGVTGEQIKTLVHDVIHDVNPNENRVLRSVLKVIAYENRIIIAPSNINAEWVRKQSKIPYQVFIDALDNNEYSGGPISGILDLYVMLVDKMYRTLSRDEKAELYHGMPESLMERLIGTNSVREIIHVLSDNVKDPSDIIDSMLIGYGYKAPFDCRHASVITDSNGHGINRYAMDTVLLLLQAFDTKEYHNSMVNDCIRSFPLQDYQPTTEQSRLYALAIIINKTILKKQAGIYGGKWYDRQNIFMTVSPLPFIYTWLIGTIGLRGLTPKQAVNRMNIMMILSELPDDEYVKLLDAKVPVFLDGLNNDFGISVQPYLLSKHTAIIFPASLGRTEDMISTALRYRGGIQRLVRLTTAELQYDMPIGETLPCMNNVNMANTIIPVDPSVLYEHVKPCMHQARQLDKKSILTWRCDAWERITSQCTPSIVELISAYNKQHGNASGQQAGAMVITTDYTTRGNDILGTSKIIEDIGMVTYHTHAPIHSISPEEKAYLRTGHPFHSITTTLFSSTYETPIKKMRGKVNLFPNDEDMSRYSNVPTCSDNSPLRYVYTSTYKWTGIKPSLIRHIADDSNYKRAQWDAMLTM